jgi:hypothetical protein
MQPEDNFKEIRLTVFYANKYNSSHPSEDECLTVGLSLWNLLTKCHSYVAAGPVHIQKIKALSFPTLFYFKIVTSLVIFNDGPE